MKKILLVPAIGLFVLGLGATAWALSLPILFAGQYLIFSLLLFVVSGICIYGAFRKKSVVSGDKPLEGDV